MVPNAIAADRQHSGSPKPQKAQGANRLKQYQACRECRNKRQRCDLGEDPSSRCLSCVKHDLPCTPQEKPSEKPTKARKCAPCLKQKVPCERENGDLAICKRCEELKIECRPQSKYLKQGLGKQSGRNTSQNGATSESRNETSYDGMLLGSMTTNQPGTFEPYGGNTGAYDEGSRQTGNGLGSGELNTHPNTHANHLTGDQFIAPQTFGSTIKGEVDVESPPGVTSAHPWKLSSPLQTTFSKGQPSVNGRGAMDSAAEALTSQWTEFLNSQPPFDEYTYGDMFEPDVVFPPPRQTRIVEQEIEVFDFGYLPLPEV